MYTTSVSSFLFLGLAHRVLAQLAQTTTVDGNGNAVYSPSAGAPTSAVAAPAFTPTLVYNCAQMPLICENVAAWAIANNNPSGDIPQNLVFYFDPDTGNKDKRRGSSCGCFSHDDCVGSGTSSGKRNGDKVTDIATSTVAVSAIDPANTNIMLAGPNPAQGQQRTPVNAVPGRFFGEGVGLTCDEFPAATFIEGGDGAKTICAMQSWQVYSGSPNNNKNVGKWPLPPKTGVRSEQDFQATCHGYLRLALGVSGAKTKKGWGSVYPFSFTTVTSQQTSSKAWVVKAGPSTQAVTKRGVHARTAAPGPVETMFVTGDELLDRRWFEEEDQNDDSLLLPAKRQAQRESPTKPFIAARTAQPIPRNQDTYSRPRNVARVLQALQPRATDDCSIDFDKQGLEDVEVGDDPYFDPLLPEDESAPQCMPGDILQSDVQASNAYLDNLGDDGYPPNNCCGGGDVSCLQIATNGTAIVSLCGGSEQQCIGCAMAANYIEGICNTCVQDGKCSGKQDINEAPGLYIEIDLNDTT